jgi:hypothetical protein
MVRQPIEHGRSAARLAIAVLVGMALLYAAWLGRAFLSGQNANDVNFPRSLEKSRADEPYKSASMAASSEPGLKPDAIQPELNHVWQALLNAESRQPGKLVEPRYWSVEEIHWLEARLRRLELELNSSIPAPADSRDQDRE